MLVISWFADGPKWENMALVTFYPQGLSYFRAFRYRDKWVSDDLLAELQLDMSKLIASSRGDTLLCAMFSTSESIIPVRKVDLNHIQTSAGEYYVYFTTGPFVDYRHCSSLLHYSDKITETIIKSNRQKLLLRSTCEISNLNFIPEKDKQAEDDSWATLLGLICADQILPLENVKRSLFVRLSSITRRDTVEHVLPSKVGTSHFRGEIHGYALQEGKYYEIELLHRIPLLIDTEWRLQEFYYTLTSSNGYLQPSPEHLEISGNYESHPIQLYARIASPEGQTISFEARDGRFAKFDKGILAGNGTLHLYDYQLYFKNRRSYWRWSKRWILPFTLIFVVLLIALILRDFDTKGWAVFDSPAIIGDAIMLAILAIVAAVGAAVFWKAS